MLPKSTEEACKLIEASYEYVYDIDNIRIFGKQKQMIKMENTG